MVLVAIGRDGDPQYAGRVVAYAPTREALHAKLSCLLLDRNEFVVRDTAVHADHACEGCLAQEALIECLLAMVDQLYRMTP